MLTVNQVVSAWGDDIKRMALGREKLAEWLNNNFDDGRYTQHFARRVLEQLGESPLGEEPQYGGVTSTHITLNTRPTPQQETTIEERLRSAYGITDTSWVPVSIWGEPHNPRAKWEKRRFEPDTEKLQAVIGGLKNAETAVDLTPAYRDAVDTPTIAVLSIRDTHFGMFSSNPRPYEKYDLEEAARAYTEAAEYLMSRAESMDVDMLVIPFGSDMLHVDGPSNATTKGTPQDITGPWWKAFQAAMESLNTVLSSATNRFSGVFLVLESGNHDSNLSKALSVALRGRWEDEVEFLDGPESVKRVSLGKTHLFFHHGDGMKIEAYPSLIHADHPDVVRRDSYVEVLSGHMHHRRRTVLTSAGDYFEPDALVHRITPALCPSSDWAEAQGYRSMPGAQLTVYDDSGFIALFDWSPVNRNF